MRVRQRQVSRGNDAEVLGDDDRRQVVTSAAPNQNQPRSCGTTRDRMRQLTLRDPEANVHEDARRWLGAGNEGGAIEPPPAKPPQTTREPSR